jgi:hypothetical protein
MRADSPPARTSGRSHRLVDYDCAVEYQAGSCSSRAQGKGDVGVGLQYGYCFIGEEADDLFVLMQEAGIRSLNVFWTFWAVMYM